MAKRKHKRQPLTERVRQAVAEAWDGGMSQGEMARQSGLSLRMVHRFLHGQHDMHADRMEALAQAVGYRIELVPTEEK